LCPLWLKKPASQTHSCGLLYRARGLAGNPPRGSFAFLVAFPNGRQVGEGLAGGGGVAAVEAVGANDGNGTRRRARLNDGRDGGGPRRFFFGRFWGGRFLALGGVRGFALGGPGRGGGAGVQDVALDLPLSGGAIRGNG